MGKHLHEDEPKVITYSESVHVFADGCEKVSRISYKESLNGAEILIYQAQAAPKWDNRDAVDEVWYTQKGHFNRYSTGRCTLDHEPCDPNLIPDVPERIQRQSKIQS